MLSCCKYPFRSYEYTWANLSHVEAKIVQKMRFCLFAKKVPGVNDSIKDWPDLVCAKEFSYHILNCLCFYSNLHIKKNLLLQCNPVSKMVYHKFVESNSNWTFFSTGSLLSYVQVQGGIKHVVVVESKALTVVNFSSNYLCCLCTERICFTSN